MPVTPGDAEKKGNITQLLHFPDGETEAPGGKVPAGHHSLPSGRNGSEQRDFVLKCTFFSFSTSG